MILLVTFVLPILLVSGTLLEASLQYCCDTVQLIEQNLSLVDQSLVENASFSLFFMDFEKCVLNYTQTEITEHQMVYRAAYNSFLSKINCDELIISEDLDALKLQVIAEVVGNYSKVTIKNIWISDELIDALMQNDTPVNLAFHNCLVSSTAALKRLINSPCIESFQFDSLSDVQELLSSLTCNYEAFVEFLKDGSMRIGLFKSSSISKISLMQFKQNHALLSFLAKIDKFNEISLINCSIGSLIDPFLSVSDIYVDQEIIIDWFSVIRLLQRKTLKRIMIHKKAINDDVLKEFLKKIPFDFAISHDDSFIKIARIQSKL